MLSVPMKSRDFGGKWKSRRETDLSTLTKFNIDSVDSFESDGSCQMDGYVGLHRVIAPATPAGPTPTTPRGRSTSRSSTYNIIKYARTTNQ